MLSTKYVEKYLGLIAVMTASSRLVAQASPDECEPGELGLIWRQRFPDPAPTPRYGPAMSFHAATGKTVLFGGKEGGGGQNRDDTWEWDGQAWELITTNGPPPREVGVLAYDSARGVSVLFGGNSDISGDLEDTWEWDGTAWTDVSTNGPSPRYGHAMCYDADRNVTWLFGGFHAGNHFNDLWQWDGTTWTEHQIAGAWPLLRRFPAMAYDSSRDVVVMFGGTTDPPRNDETWEWDGTAWMDVSTNGPSGRDVAAMVFDEARQVSVMFGGTTDSGFTNETWEYDGTNWGLRSADGPSPRYLCGLAYDSRRGATVLFGGYTADGGVPNDETWELICDSDGDGVADPHDNCPLTPNPAQQDCDTDGIGDACELDCQSNGTPDDCDIRDGTSQDCNTNGIPDECEAASPPSACQILLPISQKLHAGVPRDIKIVPTGSACDDATSEPRQGGITELRIGFTQPPGGPGPCPVTISELRCPACPCTDCPWSPYVGTSVMAASVEGNDLVLQFAPGLENARTYRFEVGSTVTTIPGQSFEVRVLKGDVTDDGLVNSADRSVVVGIWTGPGFSTRTDMNLDGVTNAADRSIVVGAWTSPQGNCAP